MRWDVENPKFHFRVWKVYLLRSPGFDFRNIILRQNRVPWPGQARRRGRGVSDGGLPAAGGQFRQLDRTLFFLLTPAFGLRSLWKNWCVLSLETAPPSGRACIKEHAQWQRDLSMRIRRTTIWFTWVQTYPQLAEQVHASLPCLFSASLLGEYQPFPQHNNPSQGRRWQASDMWTSASCSRLEECKWFTLLNTMSALRLLRLHTSKGRGAAEAGYVVLGQTEEVLKW